jgi:glycosyltransferase involved in cell wall biosynthesis
MRDSVEPAVLSVVIIARNQATHIARVVESVLAEVLVDEVLLVDSASADGTADRAKEFQIKVVQLLETQRLSPAAGRRVGFELTSGNFVLFLDGDMQLLSGWTARAVDLLSSHTDVAAVTGQVVNVFDDEQPESILESGSAKVTELRCRNTGGMAMYRRAALEQVGGFHPYLQSDEEPELCLRIQRAGLRFLKVDLPAALHFTRAPTLASLFERRRRSLYLGQGQIIRLLLGDRLLLAYLRERGYALAPAAVVAAGLAAAALSLGRRDARPIALWLGAVAAVVVAYGVRNRNVPRTAYSLLHRLFIFEGAVRGFVRGAGDPRSFSPRLRTIS